MSARRWLRLDAQWDDTEWVMMMGPLAQLAWIKLLCYVKRDGRGGEAYALANKVAAKKWDVPVRAVDEMLAAAQKDGALRVGEKWEVTKWKKYQEPDPTAAKRMRRMRARQKDEDVTVRDGSYGDVTRNAVARDHRPPTETTDVVTTAAPMAREWQSEEVGGWNGADVVAAFIEYGASQGWPRPPSGEIGKLGAAGKRLAGKHAPRQIVQAMLGMGALYPHSNGEPWDLFDLERKFTKASAAISQSPKVQEAAFDAAFRRAG